MRRAALVVLFVVGVALVAAPFAFSMFSRASDGAKMVDDFRPIMRADNVRTTADYYNNVFVPLREVVPLMSQENVDKFNGYLKGIQGTQADSAKLVPALARQLGTTPAQVQQLLATQFPSLAQMLQNLPALSKDFGGLLGALGANVDTFQRVPAGLDHYQPLVSTMQANVDTYASVDALPRMSLFPWFFLVPGILVLLASTALLVDERRRAKTASTWPGSSGLAAEPAPEQGAAA